MQKPENEATPEMKITMVWTIIWVLTCEDWRWMRQIVHGKVSAGGFQLSQMLGWQGKVSQTGDNGDYILIWKFTFVFLIQTKTASQLGTFLSDYWPFRFWDFYPSGFLLFFLRISMTFFRLKIDFLKDNKCLSWPFPRWVVLKISVLPPCWVCWISLRRSSLFYHLNHQ